MENLEILLTVNALLLSLVGIGLSGLSFFLKDVYRDHKKLQDKVSSLEQASNTYRRLFQEQIKYNQQQIQQNHKKLDQMQLRLPIAER